MSANVAKNRVQTITYYVICTLKAAKSNYNEPSYDYILQKVITTKHPTITIHQKVIKTAQKQHPTIRPTNICSYSCVKTRETVLHKILHKHKRTKRISVRFSVMSICLFSSQDFQSGRCAWISLEFQSAIDQDLGGSFKKTCTK